MKKFLSLVLALVMTMSLVTISAGAEDFTDDASINYEEAVDVMSAIGVVGGYADGSFNPTAGLSRGAAAKIICNMILGPTTAGALSADTAPYKDVATDNTYAGYIAYCAQQGIISGYADGTFRPYASLTGYAFMKMLLGALGYDADVEGYTGANWSIAVAKRALNIGLDEELDGEFVGTKALTREEACLYAFNALNADMVDYPNSSSVVVGNITVTTNASANKTGDLFREVYFTKLIPTYNTTDDFGRPATTWHNKGVKVGTYTDTPDLVYTTDQKLGTIYSDLGLTEQIDATYVRNGAAQSDLPIARGVTTYVGTGNGTLVEVYYNSTAKTIKVVAIDTYIGDVVATRAATAARDAYITLGETRYNSPMTSSTDEFETDADFAVDDVVLYTYSEMTNKIKSVVKADSFEGTLNTIHLDNKLTIDGTVYKLSAKKGTGVDDTDADLGVKSSYVVYTDEYGYIIDMEESKYVSGDYAFVEDARYAPGTWGYKQAKLVYLDGTTAKVDTNKDYSTSGEDYASQYYLVTHKTNDDGVVTLKKVDGTTYYSVRDFDLDSGVAAITVTAGKTIYANSNSIIVVKNTTDNTYTAYTGIKNMPSIAGTAKVSYYCKSGAILTYAFIETAGANITGAAQDVTFLSGVSMSKRVTDTDTIDYYQFNAVVDGKITTVKVDATLVGAATNAVYSSCSTDSDGIVTSTSTPAGYGMGTGVKKLSGEYTLGFYNGSAWVYYSIDEDCEVYMIDKDGNIEASTVSAIVSDDNQVYTYVYDTTSNQVTHVYLDEVATAISGSLMGGAPASAVSGVSSIMIARTAPNTGKLACILDGSVTGEGYTVKVQMQIAATAAVIDLGSYDVTVNAAGYVVMPITAQSGNTYIVSVTTSAGTFVGSAAV